MATRAEAIQRREERDEVFVVLHKWYDCAEQAATLARKEMRRNRVVMRNITAVCKESI